MMSLIVLPRLNFSFLAEERWGSTSLSGVARVWSVVVALAAATLAVILFNRHRLPALREAWTPAPMHRSCRRSVLPAWSALALSLPRRRLQSCRLGACYRGRPACLPRGVDERARGPHGFSLGRIDDRAGRSGADLYGNGLARRHRSSTAAPHCCGSARVHSISCRTMAPS